MNIAELHVRDYKNLQNYLGIGVGIISIGDEACVYHIPLGDEALKIGRNIIKKGYRFKLITPKLSDKHLQEFVLTLRLLHNNSIDYILVVNDLGLLYEAHKNNILPKEVFLGRGITRSLEDTPWIEEYIEDEKYPEDVLANTLADEFKIEHYSKYGVTGIETSLHINSFRGFKKITDRGWKISCHIGNYVVAFSRKCAYAIYDKLQLGECSQACKNKIEITMAQTTSDIEYQPCINKNNRDFTNLFLLGNVLYKKSEIPLCDILKNNVDIYSYVINDYDFTVSEIEELISKLQERESRVS